jgi:hypothetical protein
LHPQAKRHVLKHGHVREQGIALKDGIDVAIFGGNLGDVLVFKMDMAVIDVFQPGDKAQYGCFAAARRAKQREKLTVIDGQLRSEITLYHQNFYEFVPVAPAVNVNGVVYSIFALSHIDASGSRLKRGLCVTTLVTRNEGGHSTAIPCNRQSLSLIHKLHLLTHNDINGKILVCGIKVT